VRGSARKTGPRRVASPARARLRRTCPAAAPRSSSSRTPTAPTRRLYSCPPSARHPPRARLPLRSNSTGTCAGSRWEGANGNDDIALLPTHRRRSRPGSSTVEVALDDGSGFVLTRGRGRARRRRWRRQGLVPGPSHVGAAAQSAPRRRPSRRRARPRRRRSRHRRAARAPVVAARATSTVPPWWASRAVSRPNTRSVHRMACWRTRLHRSYSVVTAGSAGWRRYRSYNAVSTTPTSGFRMRRWQTDTR